MLDPLGALVITFVVMSLVSIVGIALMYLAKNEKVKKGFFYFLTIWGMIVAYCNALDWTSSIVKALGLGVLSVVALLIQLAMKKENKFKIARILVTISVVVGMIDCFLI